ncbi:hypothetical protein CHF27_005215 [Romboutsia maritimum]|uniref:Uncharacterized protein n=1 Tax=Romboutsia maritimum TaxID=2020948 RepID=A0A371IU36_9FIRM|nr:hypothetical protein [Romboutsia maritimum]RDY23983.1 hypothetical protein CHF27_005215 [Romboutsia maritimum]
MSRLDKNKEIKIKKKKFKFLIRIIFIMMMSFNIAICVFIVDKNAQNMLSKEGYNLNNYINKTKNVANEIYKNLNKITNTTIEKFKK